MIFENDRIDRCFAEIKRRSVDKFWEKIIRNYFDFFKNFFINFCVDGDIMSRAGVTCRRIKDIRICVFLGYR